MKVFDNRTIIGGSIAVLVLVVVAAVLGFKPLGNFISSYMGVIDLPAKLGNVAKPSPRRQQALEMMLGIGQDVDTAEAERIMRELYAAGDSLAGGYLHLLIVRGPQSRSRLLEEEAAFLEVKNDLYLLAEKGDREAIYIYTSTFAPYYAEPDWSDFHVKAGRRLADDGYLPGMLLRARMLEEGWQVKKDLNGAASLNKECDSQGCVMGKAGLGRILARRSYGGFHLSRAIKLLNEAADAGDVSSLEYLAWIHTGGIGNEP